MPLIKDKDRYKKLVNVDKTKAYEPRQTGNVVTNVTQRNRQMATDKQKSEVISVSKHNNIVESLITPTSSSVFTLTSINENQSLIDVIMYNMHSGNVGVEFGWTHTNPESITFNTGTVVVDTLITPLFKATLTSGQTISLKSVVEFARSTTEINIFKNVNKRVYFIVYHENQLAITFTTTR